MNIFQIINSIICLCIYFFFIVIFIDDMTYSKHTPLKNKLLYLLGIILFCTLATGTVVSILINW